MSATSTPYASGMKKPLNMLENPIYPDIKKGPPRFVWSRKHWDVDVGATIRDTEPYTQFIEPAILVQSRNYNKTVYGQSSHKDIVNANFRPPLQNYYEDIGPLNRVPVTIEAIIPRVNPGTAGNGAGTSGYTAKNERRNDIDSALTDRIKRGEWRPTFYAPFDVPLDNSVLPDLELKLPPISVHSGWQFPSYNTQEPRTIDLGEEKLQSIPIKSGYTTSINFNGPTGLENYETYDNHPRYSTTAGVNTPLEINTPLPMESFELSHTIPQVSADARMNTPYEFNSETRNIELKYNRPQVSADARMNTPVEFMEEIQEVDLAYNRPQGSVHSGMNTPHEFNSETPTIQLFNKIEQTPIYVTNPGSEEGYKTEVIMYNNEDQYIQENRPIYSYVVPSEEPVFRTRNVDSKHPHFREKLQPLKSYGQVAQSAGAIPRPGIEMFRETLRETSSRQRKPNKYEVRKKKVQYRF